MKLLCPICIQEGQKSLVRGSELSDGQLRLHMCGRRHRFVATYLLLPRENAPSWAKPQAELWELRYYPTGGNPEGLVIPEGFVQCEN